jgi:hypothetical protein
MEELSDRTIYNETIEVHGYLFTDNRAWFLTPTTRSHTEGICLNIDDVVPIVPHELWEAGRRVAIKGRFGDISSQCAETDPCLHVLEIASLMPWLQPPPLPGAQMVSMGILRLPLRP